MQNDQNATHGLGEGYRLTRSNQLRRDLTDDQDHKGQDDDLDDQRDHWRPVIGCSNLMGHYSGRDGRTDVNHRVHDQDGDKHRPRVVQQARYALRSCVLCGCQVFLLPRVQGEECNFGTRKQRRQQEEDQ